MFLIYILNFHLVKDFVTTAASQVNIAAVVAGVLGGALLATVICILFFILWKRRAKKKGSFQLSSLKATDSLPSSTPVVAPALYDICLSSRRTSSVLSAPTLNYHTYEELT